MSARSSIPLVLASLSGAERAHLCPGSTALDRVDNSGGESGSAAHEYLATLVPRGRAAAEGELPAILARWDISEREEGFLRAKLRAFDPPVPKHDDGHEVTPALTEIALCFMAVRRVVEVSGARGRYDVPEGAVIPGSIDVMWSEPEPLRVETCEACGGEGWLVADDGAPPLTRCATCNGFGRRVVCQHGSVLWLVDWKSGADRNVPRAERNRQIRWGAAIAARWTGAERVVAAICYLESTEGRWDYRQHPGLWGGAPTPHPYDRAELLAIEEEMLADHARWLEQRRRRGAGEALELMTGGQCEYCPSRVYCPAHVQPARALVALDPAGLKAGALTREEAAQLAEWLPMAKRAVAAVEDALEASVEADGPIPLSDGRIYGRQVMPWKKKALDARAAFDVLAEEIGADAAEAAMSTSIDAMKDAIATAHAAKGIRGQGKATLGRVLAKLYQADAITETPVVHMHAHHPVHALPAAAEAPQERTGT